MCGRFEVFTYEEVAQVVAAVEARRAARIPAPAAPRAHARPSSRVLLFGHGAGGDEQGDGQLQISQVTWGFKPEWSAKPVFNTRVESMLGGSVMWRDAAENGRCIIPAAAFYEPHATETVPSPRTGRPMKRPYRFAMPDDEPLLLAGVQQDGFCSVVTCPPNRWVSPVHNRMPLALRFHEVATWLSPEWPALTDRADLELFAQPERIDAPDKPAPSDQLSLF